jgi:hypothetical protein
VFRRFSARLGPTAPSPTQRLKSVNSLPNAQIDKLAARIEYVEDLYICPERKEVVTDAPVNESLATNARERVIAFRRSRNMNMTDFGSDTPVLKPSDDCGFTRAYWCRSKEVSLHASRWQQQYEPVNEDNRHRYKSDKQENQCLS